MTYYPEEIIKAAAVAMLERLALLDRLPLENTIKETFYTRFNVETKTRKNSRRTKILNEIKSLTQSQSKSYGIREITVSDSISQQARILASQEKLNS